MGFKLGNKLGVNGRPRKHVTSLEQARARTASSWKYQGIKNHDGSDFGLVDYDRAYQIQHGRCPGCKKHASELSRPLAVDHDHNTGRFRGLLCIMCNLILGHAKDNCVILQNLISYTQGGNFNE
jgi:hypothetical protein